MISSPIAIKKMWNRILMKIGVLHVEAFLGKLLRTSLIPGIIFAESAL